MDKSGRRREEKGMLEGERTDRTQVIAEVYISGWSNNGPKPHLRRAERALLSAIGYASNE